MKKFDLKKAACDVAIATAQQNLAAVDAATSAQAGELKLSDPEYQQFRNDVLFFRNPFNQAYQADQKADAATTAMPATTAQVKADPAK